MKKYVLITVLVLIACWFLCIGVPVVHCQELSEFQKSIKKATMETNKQLQKE